MGPWEVPCDRIRLHISGLEQTVAVQGNHEAVTQNPIPEPPLLQEVATAINLCFPGKHQPLICSRF